MFDIQGTNNSERLVGTAASESIYTGDGADTVLAGGGNHLRVPDGFYLTGSLQVRQTDGQLVDLSGVESLHSASSAMALGANGQALSKLDATPHAIDIDVSTGIDSVQIVGVLRGDVDDSWTAPVN